jgi:hypothetical protein
MLQVTPKDKQENKVVHILHELAKQEGLTPAGWLRIRIMQEGKRKGLVPPNEPITPYEPKPEEKPNCESIDEWPWED